MSAAEKAAAIEGKERNIYVPNDILYEPEDDMTERTARAEPEKHRVQEARTLRHGLPRLLSISIDTPTEPRYECALDSRSKRTSSGFTQLYARCNLP